MGGGGTSRVRPGGLVEHTVGSSGHRPPVGGVPGTGRSLDHEPLRGSSSSGEGSGGRRVWWGRGRWLFENCTVDASIFVKIKTHPLGVWFLVLCSFVVFVEVFKGSGWMPWH